MNDKVDFLHADNHKNVQQIDTMILMGMVKHPQSSQKSKFAMFLISQKKKLKMKLTFCMQINITVSASWHYLF